MSTIARNQTRETLSEAASGLRGNSLWFIAIGVLQILLGVLAFSFSFSAMMASVALFGFPLLIAAGAQVAAAVLAQSWRGFFLFLLVGILYAVTGLLALSHSIAVAEGLTLMIAGALLAGGMFRIVVALLERFPSWGWMLCNGVMSVLLGTMIAMQWPVSGLWVIGAFIGIDLIANGITWTTQGAAVRVALAPFSK
jgi:uncharacterized membrane protein HdeD (DUF308 family)